MHVLKLLADHGSTQSVLEGRGTPLDFDDLSESTLKLFGDIFEALIGAMFLDSEDLQLTRKVLLEVLKPYMQVYAHSSDELQEHSRTQLLELWNSTEYRKYFKCSHDTDGQHASYMTFKGYLEDAESGKKTYIFEERYSKEEKSKVRLFYKDYLQCVKQLLVFIDSNQDKGLMNGEPG